MEGIITRITLENFVTYKRVELRPKRNLNVIVGPNGTGKSTIVSAILLGLGGQPKVVARGAKIGSYVREGCQDATIEIELLNPNGKNHVIKRSIDVHNKSVWAYNGKTVPQKEIERVTSELNIHVDNLCQFLPQDRVQDFAKMDQKSLLENTEHTVGSGEMYEQHMELKQLRSGQQEKEKVIRDLNAKRAVEQQLNDRNSVQVTNMTEKKVLMDTIGKLQQKRAWAVYYKMNNEKNQLQGDKVLAVKEHERYTNLFEPMEALMKKIMSRLQMATNKRTKAEEVIRSNNRVVKDSFHKCESIEEKIDENAEKFKRDKALEQSRNDEILRLSVLVNKSQNDAEAARSEQVIRDEIRNIEPLIIASSGRFQTLQNHFGDRKSELDNIGHEERALLAEKRRVENTLNQKLDLVKRNNPDVYKALMWLRENKQQFKAKVYEPMVLEINVTDLKYAKFVEHIIPYRDLFAFTCEDRDDMNSMCRTLRDQMGLKVNFLHSEQGGHQFQPRDRIESLRQYGFETYARETFTAPDVIMNYLCLNSNVHKVPIGNDKTFLDNDKVPKHITKFYSENHQFSITKSAYCGDPIARREQVGRANYLASASDPAVLQDIHNQLQAIDARKKRAEQLAQSIRERMRDEENEMDKHRLVKKKLLEEIDNRRLIQARLNTRKQQLQQLQSEKFDIQQLEERYMQSCKADTLKMVKLQRDILKLMTENHKSYLESDILKEQAVRLGDLKLIKENESQDLKAKKRQAERMVQLLQSRIATAKAECQRLHSIAKEATNGLAPSHPECIMNTPELDSMPSDVLQLDNLIEENQAKVDCLGTDDDNLIHEYERRKKLIASLTEQVEKQEKDVADTQATMDAIRDEWLPTLQELISRINLKFGQSFNHLGCAGEVTLTKSENENDYHLYGLCIKVKYRDSESLQELNQHLQSGGERAVATAIYMISLQDLTKVPFRCVDEINQGMDPVNERLIFDLLVTTTNASDTAQYFLLTPKLLPSLKYEESVNVICVCNGPSVNTSVWDVKKFVTNLNTSCK